MHIRHTAAAVAAALVLGAAVPAARAFDLTGLWVGNLDCKGFSGVRTKFKVRGINMFITHDAANRYILVQVNGQTYQGVTVDDVSKPNKGEMALANCGTDDDLLTVGASDEMGRFTVQTSSAKGTGSIKGSTIVSAGSVLEISTCKWSFKRRDLTDPGIVTCP